MTYSAENDAPRTVGTIPHGWYVLWCPDCFTSLAWTRDDIAARDDMHEWQAELNWAVSECDHDMSAHTPIPPADLPCLVCKGEESHHAACSVPVLGQRPIPPAKDGDQ